MQFTACARIMIAVLHSKTGKYSNGFCHWPQCAWVQVGGRPHSVKRWIVHSEFLCPCCAVLWCGVPCCAVLCCAALCRCAALCLAVPCRAVPLCPVPYLLMQCCKCTYALLRVQSYPIVACSNKNRMQLDGSFKPSKANFTSLADPAAVGSGLTALTTLMHGGWEDARLVDTSTHVQFCTKRSYPTCVHLSFTHPQHRFVRGGACRPLR